MKETGVSTQTFFGLLKAGLWEQETRLSLCKKIDFGEVWELAQEQSVLGLVTAGLDYVVDIKVPYDVKLIFLGIVSEVERRNKVMNQFVAELVDKMTAEVINVVLVKGQGIAQCYEKPLWRCAGDIDLLLDEDNYNKAKALLTPLSEKSVSEEVAKRHLSIQLSGFTIELHGRMPFALSRRTDKVIDEVITDSLLGISGERLSVRVWNNGNTDVYLPNADNDVILVFTHYLHHFFIEGVGLKQICDWCRLLWTYRDEIDRRLLESRLDRMGLISEWKAFASLAVNYLGMPEDAMPFYDKRYRRRGAKVLSHVLKSGNLGHNNNQRYRSKLSKPMADTITFFRRIWDFTKFAFIFPMDVPRFFFNYVINKVLQYEKSSGFLGLT